jgi:hypothetical protein
MTQGDGPAWSSRGRLLPLLAAILPRTNAGRNSRAIRYAPALPSSAEVDERYVQKRLGHASAEMPHK